MEQKTDLRNLPAEGQRVSCRERDIPRFRSLLNNNPSLSLIRGPYLASVGAFLVTMVIVLIYMNAQQGGNPDDFEVGKVADRDVIAGYAVTYEDAEATRLRQDAFEHQTPAVFIFSQTATEEMAESWNSFADTADTLHGERASRERFVSSIQQSFPGLFQESFLDDVYRIEAWDELLRRASVIFGEIIEKGIFAYPSAGMERLNQDVVELVRGTDTEILPERIPINSLITLSNLGENLNRIVSADPPDGDLLRFGGALILPFVFENAYFSRGETAQRVTENRRMAEPVLRHIERDKRIIRKGFIVTEEDMTELNMILELRPGRDGRAMISNILVLLLLFAVLFYYCSQEIIGRKLTHAESYLVSALSALYLIGTVLMHRLNFGDGSMYLSLIMPTAFVIMLPSILISLRLAVFLALIFPMGAFFIGSFDASSFVFAVMSGVVAAFALRDAEKRMDVIKAGLIVAAANCIAMVAGLLSRRAALELYPSVLFWASFNGLASGILVLGFLPPLESLLNAATAFRLIELSDLNAPVLRKLFAVAPGTYSHSIMVANLAEAACQDIGANALLARVGAYYHDLGKMENPDYFVENQTDYNKHDQLEPRRSAEIIRSHVLQGLEKGNQMRLPAKVMEIIGEHHGNSVITWFYSKALQQEEQVIMDDFSYPGNPPRSRESTVVMLADTVEAAVRTLDKPTAAKLDEFIKELFNAKLEHGQLAMADLTFSELETIRNAFVRALVGNLHSRIVYPKLEKEALRQAAARGAEE